MIIKHETIMSIEKKEDFFSTIINSNKNMNWNDIFIVTKEYKNHKLREDFSIVFKDVESIKFLEELGFDLNHKDVDGNNLSYFVLNPNQNIIKEDQTFKVFFLDKAIDYIVSKSNIYEVNNDGEQLVSAYLGQTFKVFNDFIQKYPNFDFNLKNKKGENLIIQGMSRFKNEKIINFLIDKKDVSIFEVDNNNNSISEYIFHYEEAKKSTKLFYNIINKIDLTERRNENSLLFYLLENIDKNTGVMQERMIFWLSEIFDYIISGNIYKKENTIDKLSDILSEYKEQLLSVDNEEFKRLFKEAKSVTSYIVLKKTLPEKDNVLKSKLNKV